ncbi:DUF6629 family protein [Patulibacter americanus]|uniref:DUF6629 family protein n=1 Tax=Patulibacter americanus TaxID=588672 RepID=UPI0003B66455|nr:DUF6629 family protein [Patulibacter americanus]
MCLSPEVDFVAGTAIAGVGVATLMAVRRPRDLVIGALPLGFGLHQITEGFVWLGLRGQVSPALGDAARDAYVIYAQAILPMLVPIGFALLERDARRRRWLWPFVVLGVLTGLFLLWQVTHWPILAEERAHCVAYTTHTPYAIPSATAYVLAVCAPALLSSRRHLRTFGIVNVVGLAFAATLQEEEFTSVWCLYAAVMSVLILAHFRRERAGPDEVDPPGPTPTAGDGAAGRPRGGGPSITPSSPT